MLFPESRGLLSVSPSVQQLEGTWDREALSADVLEGGTYSELSSVTITVTEVERNTAF